MIRPLQQDPGTGIELGDRVEDDAVRRLKQLALPPKDFHVKREGSGLRLVAIDRDLGDSGSVKYQVLWAEDVNTSTRAGELAGFARAEVVASIDRDGRDGHPVSTFLSDPKFQTGYFYCRGVDALARAGTSYKGPVSVQDAILDDRIPLNVSHWDVSESGERHGDTVISLISFAYVSPKDRSFGGIQVVADDYPNPGDRTKLFVHRYRGTRGGSAQGAERLHLGRRKGVGTISISGSTVTGSGSEFLVQANAGDKIEILGIMVEVLTVDSNTQITLTAGWSGPTVSALADWEFIAKVRLYAVALSKADTHRPDIENSPYKDVVLDGLLSAPIAPVLDGYSIENGVRLEWPQVQGAEIKRYLIYRGTGAGVSFASCDQIASVDHDPNILAASSRRQWEDREFSIYEREIGQIFSYYVVAENARGGEDGKSSPSNREDVACRLTTYSDTDPTIPSRNVYRNRLFNSFISGTDGNTVDSADTDQDAAMGAPPTGWSRWHSDVVDGHPSRAVHANGEEVRFPVATGSGQKCRLYQEIDAWDHGANRKLRKGGYVAVQIRIRTAAGANDGTFSINVQQWDGATFSGSALLRTRLSDDTLDETGSVLVLGCDELSTDYAILSGVWRLDRTLTTTKVRVVFQCEGVQAEEVFVQEAMLNEGEEISAWTPDMGDTDLNYPNGSGLAHPPRSDGGLRQAYQVP